MRAGDGSGQTQQGNGKGAVKRMAADIRWQVRQLPCRMYCIVAYTKQGPVVEAAVPACV